MFRTIIRFVRWVKSKSLLECAWISVDSRIQHLAFIYCFICFFWPFEIQNAVILEEIAFEMVLASDNSNFQR